MLAFNPDTSVLNIAPPSLRSLQAIPQSQPFGFSEEKAKMRILSMNSALKYQGPLSPRTKLHHFQMFPYSSEAHEAAFLIQRFWERHIRKRMRAATLVQAHYRKMRCRREFMDFVRRVRRARAAIRYGAKRWLDKVRLEKDAEFNRRMVLEELARETIEEAYEEEKISQFCKNALYTLVCRYRWKKRRKKVRERQH